VFIHANLRLSLGPVSPVVAGPQLHRIHHSLEPRHRDRNYAAFFPLWDVLFGSYYAPKRDEYPRTGLATGERVTSIGQALWLPFATWFGRREPKPPATAPLTATGPSADSAAPRPRRWVALASIGCVLVVCLLVLELAARIVLPKSPTSPGSRTRHDDHPSMRGKHYLMTRRSRGLPGPCGLHLHPQSLRFRDGTWDVGPKRRVSSSATASSRFMAADAQTVRCSPAGRSGWLQVCLGVGGAIDGFEMIRIVAMPTVAAFCVLPTISPALLTAVHSSRIRAAPAPGYRGLQVLRRIRGEPVPRAWNAAPVPLAAVPDPSIRGQTGPRAPRFDTDIAT
jgi:hypothetical protein